MLSVTLAMWTTPRSREDPRVRKGFCFYKAAEGVSHFKNSPSAMERRHDVTIYTVDRHGRPGMPTFNVKKVRRLLKSGRAEIFCYRPFTIKLLYADSLDVQPVELCMDTGDRHIGISVKSEKHEYAHVQLDPLPDEKERHDSRRMYRRQRRSRLRCRKPKSDNKSKGKGMLAPSLQHKKELHLQAAERYCRVCPIREIVVETGSFDTQALEAVEKGLPLPEGTGYQKGPRYRLNTLRDAVFFRDGHKCRLCGRADRPLRVHHLGYWKGDHTDRMSGLVTLCTDCHTPANHKKGGPLYGWEPEVRPMRGAAFMNSVRWQLARELKERTGLPVHTTYGSATKTARQALCIEKTHANDAFVMGDLHPRHRSKEKVFKKRRRNNRVLEKFYDARYADVRDGKIKCGQELSCGRTKRCEPRNSEKDLRMYRGHKVKKGRVSVRRRRYSIQPGTLLMYQGRKVTAKGVHCRGARVMLDTGKSAAVSRVSVVRHPGGWIQTA